MAVAGTRVVQESFSIKGEIGVDVDGRAGGRAGGGGWILHSMSYPCPAAMMIMGGRRHVVIVAISDSKSLYRTSAYFKSTSSLPKYFQSTSDIFEVTLEVRCTYVRNNRQNNASYVYCCIKGNILPK